MKVAYLRKADWLGLYQRKASLAFWEEQWRQITEEELRHILRDTCALPPNFGWLFSRWLPKEGLILEIGCGTAHIVRRLRARGYHCLGLDYAFSGLVRSKKVCAELPLIGGHALQLPFADGSLSAIVSFGLVEHFEEGPGAALREMARVLKPGGIALISVPYLNPLRAHLSAEPGADGHFLDLEFYQYYFSRSDFQQELEKAGLHPLGPFFGYTVLTGLKEKLQWVGAIARHIPSPGMFSAALDLIPGLTRLAAHMILLPAAKI